MAVEPIAPSFEEFDFVVEPFGDGVGDPMLQVG